MDQAKDLNDFIKLANVVRSLDTTSLDKFRKKLYIAFYKFANRKEVFNDVKALQKAHKLHSKIVDEDPSAFHFEEIKDSK